MWSRQNDFLEIFFSRNESNHLTLYFQIGQFGLNLDTENIAKKT